MSYTTLDQLNHYQGNSPWCYSVQRANSFSSDRPPSDSLEGSNQDCTNNGKGYETRAETDSCCAKESAGSWCATPNYKAGTGYCHGDPSVACKWSPCGEDTCYSCKNFNCMEDSSSSQTLSACKAQCKAPIISPAWVKPTTKPWCTCSSGEPHKLFKHYNIATDPNNSCNLSCTGVCSSDSGGPCSDPAYFPPPNPSASAATESKSVWQCVIKDEESQTDSAKITLNNSLTTGKPQRWYRFNDQPNDPNNSCETNCKKENLDPIASKYGIDLECKEVTDSYNPSCAEIWNWSMEKGPSRGGQNTYDPSVEISEKNISSSRHSSCVYPGRRFLTTEDPSISGWPNTRAQYQGGTCTARDCGYTCENVDPKTGFGVCSGLPTPKDQPRIWPPICREDLDCGYCQQTWTAPNDSPCLYAESGSPSAIYCHLFADGAGGVNTTKLIPKSWDGCAAYTFPEDLIANADPSDKSLGIWSDCHSTNSCSIGDRDSCIKRDCTDSYAQQYASSTERPPAPLPQDKNAQPWGSEGIGYYGSHDVADGRWRACSTTKEPGYTCNTTDPFPSDDHCFQGECTIKDNSWNCGETCNRHDYAKYNSPSIIAPSEDSVKN